MLNRYESYVRWLSLAQMWQIHSLTRTLRLTRISIFTIFKPIPKTLNYCSRWLDQRLRTSVNTVAPDGNKPNLPISKTTIIDSVRTTIYDTLIQLNDGNPSGSLQTFKISTVNGMFRICTITLWHVKNGFWSVIAFRSVGFVLCSTRATNKNNL